MTRNVAPLPVRTLSKDQGSLAYCNSVTELGGATPECDKLAAKALRGLALFNAVAALVHHYILGRCRAKANALWVNLGDAPPGSRTPVDKTVKDHS